MGPDLELGTLTPRENLCSTVTLQAVRRLSGEGPGYVAASCLSRSSSFLVSLVRLFSGRSWSFSWEVVILVCI